MIHNIREQLGAALNNKLGLPDWMQDDYLPHYIKQHAMFLTAEETQEAMRILGIKEFPDNIVDDSEYDDEYDYACDGPGMCDICGDDFENNDMEQQ